MLSLQMNAEPSFTVVDLITTDEDKKFAPAGRMAAAIIEITQEMGGCSPKNLYEKGFPPTEVTKHWHMAQSLAAVELGLMRKHLSSLKSLFKRRC